MDALSGALRLILIVTLASAALVASGCASRNPEYQLAASDPELLHTSVNLLTDVIIYDIFSPPQASRIYAYAAIAAYEALASTDSTYQTLAGQLNELDAVPSPEPGKTYVYPLAAVHALLTVGRALTFSEEQMDASIEKMHARYRETGMPHAVFERSVAYGERVASHILDWASTDFYRESRSAPKYTVTDDPGRWRPTPPAYMDGVEPNWGRIRPFALDSSAQYAPSPPPPFDMAERSAFYQEVLKVYEAGSSLTPEQVEIASFWDCNPYVLHLKGHTMFATKKITPGGHWVGVTAIAGRQSGADVLQSAEAYARVAIAMADGFISSWEEKYRSQMVRPETVINRHIDPDWRPLLQTPPFPEHTSAHSVISNAAATVLTDLFGEQFAFTDTTEVRFGLPARSFGSFREASEEAAISRLYGGIHYLSAIQAGIEQGNAIGHHHLRRVSTCRVESLASRG